MTVKISPRKSETWYSRHAWLARSVAALCLAGVGCMDVLDIPEHPRLVKDTATSPEPVRAQQAADPEISPASVSEGVTARSEADITARVGETQPTSPQFDGSEPSPLSAPGPVTLEPEAADAGPPASSLPPLDATSPFPEHDASSPAVCAASAVLGPNGNCYAALATRRTWMDSRQRCRALGAGWDIASIRSDEVNRFLADLLSSETWIGASDSNVEGTWIWVDDGTVFWRGDGTGSPVNGAYANWNRTEPNSGANADCARLVPELSLSWADLSCTEQRSVVCEGPPR